MRIRRKPYIEILPPVFGNLIEQKRDLGFDLRNNNNIKYLKAIKFYKPIKTIVNFNNENFEIVR